jgi:hypothetical protein
MGLDRDLEPAGMTAPATSGRRYVIARELAQDGYATLTALAVDYLQVAARLGEIPMARPLEDDGE